MRSFPAVVNAEEEEKGNETEGGWLRPRREVSLGR